MCVICISPSGTEKDSEFFIKALTNSIESNGDGAGYAFKRVSTKKVFVSKGYYTIQSLLEDISKRKLKKEDELVVHFRIGNKGAKNIAMMHPFVCGNSSEEVLQNHKYVEKPILFHNGTLIDFCGDSKSEFSDTYRFARYFLSNKHIQNLLIEEEGDIEFESMFDFTLKLNRLAIMYPNITKSVTKVGKFIEEEGYFFSNEGYKTKGYKNIGGKSSYYPTHYQEWNKNHKDNSNEPILDKLNTDEYDENDWFKASTSNNNIVEQVGREKARLRLLDINRSRDNKQNAKVGRSYGAGEIAVNSVFIHSKDKVVDTQSQITYCRVGGFYLPEILKSAQSNQFDASKIVINKYNYTELIFLSKVNVYNEYNINNTYKIIKYNEKDGIHTLGRFLNEGINTNLLHGIITIDEETLYQDFDIRPEVKYEDKYLTYYEYLVYNPISKTAIKKLSNFLNTKVGKKEIIPTYKQLTNVLREDLLFICIQSLMFFNEDNDREVDTIIRNKALIL